MNQENKPEESLVIKQTKAWVKDIVIDNNFCPFAANPFVQDKIRFKVSDAIDGEKLVDDLVNELSFLQDADINKLETSLLIVPEFLNNFEDYNQFLDVVDEILAQMSLVGEIQIASFHPNYQFADLSSTDVRNYTNRSIYPMFHLIREVSVENARNAYPDVENIPNNNMEKLETMGLEAVNAVLMKISEKNH